MKKLISFVLALAASVGTVFAESGTCGYNLTWDLSNGVLTISGSGIMDDYKYMTPPWFSQQYSIKEVSIGNDVTRIGYSAFCDCSNLISVTIGNSVTFIGGHAFANCSSLTSVTIPNSVTFIEYCAFKNCTDFTSNIK